MATKPGLNAATPVTEEMLASKRAEVTTLADRLVEATNDLAEMEARHALSSALQRASESKGEAK